MIRGFPLDPPCPVDGDLMEVIEASLPPVVTLGEMGTGEVAYQLDRLQTAAVVIRSFVNRRVAGARHDIDADWRALIDAELGSSGETDQLEGRARDEKAAMLAELAASRVSVLIGPAGTGKTTLLNVLVNYPAISAGGTLLLAPTGKARVRRHGTRARRELTPCRPSSRLAGEQVWG